jgi:DNA-binding NarL/FixJ family response regulator
MLIQANVVARNEMTPAPPPENEALRPGATEAEACLVAALRTKSAPPPTEQPVYGTPHGAGISPSELSERERDVVQLVAQGANNRERWC